MRFWSAVMMMAVLGIAVGGCGKKPEPAPPAPVPGENGSEREAAERARREAAERARLAEEERARAEAEERARREAAMNAARATLGEMIYFDFDDARIKPEAASVLDAKIRVLREYSQVRLRIAGHCDERGSNEYNDALGSRRASSVRAYLTAAGINESRFEIISFGEDRPLARGHDEAAWARNRRAEFQILSGLGG